MSATPPTTLRRRGSSKACDECRARKIRCDQRNPICSQCEKKGISCSGPVVGCIFVDAGTTIVTRHSSTKDNIGKMDLEEEKSSCTTINYRKGTLPYRKKKREELQDHRCQPKNASKVTTLDLVPHARLSSSKPYMRYQPSLAIPSRQQLFLKLIEAFGYMQKRHPACDASMAHVMSYFSESAPASIVSAMNAVSIAFYGRTRNDEAAKVLAYKWYAKALMIQRRRLQQETHGLHRRIPTPEDIFVPFSLAVYEMTVPTVRNGWLEHLRATARLLEMRGPEGCQSGLVFQMFRSIRFAMVCGSIIERVPVFLATERWRTVPFSQMFKTFVDKLLDVLCIISLHLETFQKLNPDTVSISAREENRFILIGLEKKLDDILLEAVAMHTLNHTIPTLSGPETAFGGMESVKNDFRELFDVEERALFYSCKLLISACLVGVSPPGLANEHKDRLNTACASILSILEEKKLLLGENEILGLHRMKFPTLLIRQWSFDDAQRSYVAKNF